MNQKSTSYYSNIFGIIMTWQLGYVKPCFGHVMCRFNPLCIFINPFFNALFDIHPPTPSFCPKWSHLKKLYAKNDRIASFFFIKLYQAADQLDRHVGQAILSQFLHNIPIIIFSVVRMMQHSSLALFRKQCRGVQMLDVCRTVQHLNTLLQ